MRRFDWVGMIALALGLVALACPRASAEEEAADENHYETADTVEIGGSLGLNWTQSLFTIDLSPQVGWFVADGIELSAIFRFGYQNSEDDDGERSDVTVGALIFEPSYHFPIHDESVFAFGGLGVGPGYDGDNFDFRLIPRVGLNVEIGGGGVLNPAVRVPILFGKKSGPDNEDFGVDVGFGLEVGVTTTL